MQAGKLIGDYYIDRVIEPYDAGQAVLEVRYEGTYLKKIMVVADIEVGDSSSLGLKKTEKKISAKIESFREALRGISQKYVKVLLPEGIKMHAFSHTCDQLLMIYSEKDYLEYIDSCGSEFARIPALKKIAGLIDMLHAKKIGHGFLHPQKIRGTNNVIILPCPIWEAAINMGNEELEEVMLDDRRRFAMMFADAKRNNMDMDNFDKRLENMDPYIKGFPQITEFINNSEKSFTSLFDEIVNIPRRTNHGKKVLRFVLFIVVLSCLLVLISFFMRQT